MIINKENILSAVKKICEEYYKKNEFKMRNVGLTIKEINVRQEYTFNQNVIVNLRILDCFLGNYSEKNYNFELNIYQDELVFDSILFNLDNYFCILINERNAIKAIKSFNNGNYNSLKNNEYHTEFLSNIFYGREENIPIFYINHQKLFEEYIYNLDIENLDLFLEMIINDYNKNIKREKSLVNIYYDIDLILLLSDRKNVINMNRIEKIYKKYVLLNRM